MSSTGSAGSAGSPGISPFSILFIVLAIIVLVGLGVFAGNIGWRMACLHHELKDFPSESLSTFRFDHGDLLLFSDSWCRLLTPGIFLPSLAASFRRAPQRDSSKPLRWVNPKLVRSRPGGLCAAISAASIANVPLPHIGLNSGTEPS